MRSGAYLHNLKRIRQSRELSPKQVCALTGIEPARYSILESIHKNRIAEPWFNEACAIARVLNVDGIAPLISDSPLSDVDLGAKPYDDLAVWRADVRLPLTVACRLAVRFHITDPLELDIAPTIPRQIWDILHTGERQETRGCPWCLAASGQGEPHLDTCLPHFLWGSRGTLPASSLGFTIWPDTPGKRASGNGPGHGLRPLRDGLGLTQAKMAERAGVTPQYWAMLERLASPLTENMARRFALAFSVDWLSLYARGSDNPPPCAADDPDNPAAWENS